MRSLALNLRQGSLSLREWRQAMREAIAHRHLYSAAMARGGWAQMDRAAYGQVGGVVRSEYRYLERWVQQIARGAPLDGHFLNRATLYTQAGRETYHRAERDVATERGMDQEANVLAGEAQHCEGAGSCPAESRRGWVPIGKLKPVGRRRCGRRCRCRVKYRRRP